MRWTTLTGAVAMVLSGCSAEGVSSPGTDRSEPEIEEAESKAPTPATLNPEAADERTGCPACVEVVKGGEVNGLSVVEGDILIADEAELKEVQGIAASTTATRIWTGGPVPYVIDAAVTKRERITEAAKHWRDLVGIRLVPRTNQADYVRVVKGTGCTSFIGRRGGVQDLNLADECSLGNTIHEFGHAIGLNHEQSRADRDEFVTVVEANIEPASVFNYRRVTFVSIGAYDLGSIMHYGSYFFAIPGKPAMTKKSGELIVPNRASLSPGDVAGVRRLYAAQNLPAPVAYATAIPVASDVVLRDGPAATAKPLGKVPKGSMVQGQGAVSGNYQSVAFDGKKGWAYLPFVGP